MHRVVLIGLTTAFLWTGVDLVRPAVVAELPKPTQYRDGRPAAKLRLDAVDHGVVLRHGDGPGQCDIHGARDVWVYEADGTYYMHYDAAGPKGWLAALATSKDLIHWQKKGPVLELGKAGENDSASASYGTTYYDGRALAHVLPGHAPYLASTGLGARFPLSDDEGQKRRACRSVDQAEGRDPVPGEAGHLLLRDRQPRPDHQAGRRVPHVLQCGDRSSDPPHPEHRPHEEPRRSLDA